MALEAIRLGPRVPSADIVVTRFAVGQHRVGPLRGRPVGGVFVELLRSERELHARLCGGVRAEYLEADFGLVAAEREIEWLQRLRS